MLVCHLGGVPAPPGVVILAPPEVLRNAERAQCEGRARGRSIHKARPKGSIKAGALSSPGPVHATPYLSPARTLRTSRARASTHVLLNEFFGSFLVLATLH